MGHRVSNPLAKIAALCAPFVRDGDGAEAWAKLGELMNATRRQRGAKLPDGGYEYEDVPDGPVQLVATVKRLEWCIGKPMTTALNVSANANGGELTQNQQIERMLTTPAAIESAQNALDKLKKLIPIEINGRKALPEESSQPPESQSGGS